jgi:hypothetical protein
MRGAILAVLFLVVPALADNEKPAVRELPTKDVKVVAVERGKATEPAEIKSADELAKSPLFADDASRDAVKKQVDFAKEKLVVFSWGGSGQDRIAGELKAEDKSATAVFTYTRGLTRDFRQHASLFAVPKDSKVTVVPAK